MRDLGIDQSLSKCAFTLLEDGVPTSHFLSKTGASKVKGKRPDTTYYDCLHDQIHHICLDLIKQVEQHNPDTITFEALSFASVGDVTRSLASLYGAMRETLISIGYDGIVREIPPTTLKSYAHNFLDEDRKYEGLTAAKKPKKVKMDKKLMVEAVRNIYGDSYLSKYNYSSGLDDLADSTFLAHLTWSKGIEKT